jgi:hypothetical protein
MLQYEKSRTFLLGTLVSGTSKIRLGEQLDAMGYRYCFIPRLSS